MNTGIIYIIKCKDPKIEQCYIGSTTNFNKRKVKHKSNCNNKNSRKYNYKVYKFIRENDNFDNFYFEILQDEIEFNHRKELEIIERFYIEDIGFNLTLNTIIPTRTSKEYDEKNKDKKNKRQKEYYLLNKDKINKNSKEKKKEYYLLNKEKIKQKQNEKYKQKKIEENNKRFLEEI